MNSNPSQTATPATNRQDTQEALQKPLTGRFLRSIKITIIGAGSLFTRQLVNDILQIPETRGGEIALVDIDNERLGLIVETLEILKKELGSNNWRITASTDRCDALAGTDYVINCIEVSGLECVRFDNEIPSKYGVHQCIADTAGPGGLFKAFRTIPVWLQILSDIEKLCSDALVLNYTNPMSMMCLAAARSSAVRVVGLCHSVQGTSSFLASPIYCGVPYEELEWECAGINHLAWFVKLRHKGIDQYPKLIRQAKEIFAAHSTDPGDEYDLVRKDMMVHFGAFITESSGHLSEYLPYYRKRPDALVRYARENHSYMKFWPAKRAKRDALWQAILRGEESSVESRSWEYASWIIEAIEKDAPIRIHGNVPNSSGHCSGHSASIENLPGDGCVEVACLVDRNGVQPTRFGRLPSPMAALCASNMYFFDAAVEAALARSKTMAARALSLDPLTAAVCTPSEILTMTEELFEAQQAYLPPWNN